MSLSICTIPRLDNEPVRQFFERYERHAPFGRTFPWRFEIDSYGDFKMLTLPNLVLCDIDEAVEWCVYNVEAKDWYNRGLTFYFTHDADAALFKLTFETVIIE